MGVNSWQHLWGLRKSGSEVNLQHEFTEIDIQRRLILISSSIKAEKNKVAPLYGLVQLHDLEILCTGRWGCLFFKNSHILGVSRRGLWFWWVLLNFSLQSFTQIIIFGKDVDLSVFSNTSSFFKALPVVPHLTVRFRDCSQVMAGAHIYICWFIWGSAIHIDTSPILKFHCPNKWTWNPFQKGIESYMLGNVCNTIQAVSTHPVVSVHWKEFTLTWCSWVTIPLLTPVRGVRFLRGFL